MMNPSAVQTTNGKWLRVRLGCFPTEHFPCEKVWSAPGVGLQVDLCTKYV